VYIQRINLVLDYIRGNLTDDLSLERLAQVACFSPFHFQRYGLAPSAWDRRSPLSGEDNRKIGQAFCDFPYYTEAMLEALDAASAFRVMIAQQPARTLAYIRVQNAYRPGRLVAAYDRLLAWYARHGGPLKAHLWGMSQDDPDITPLRLCRYDICLILPQGWQGDEAVSVRAFPACTVARPRCQGDIHAVDRAWQFLYRHWLPKSRFQPDNLPAIEQYNRHPAEIGWLTYDLDCVIPIVALN
jgi:AraC family transcriptional regulator